MYSGIINGKLWGTGVFAVHFFAVENCKEFSLYYLPLLCARTLWKSRNSYREKRDVFFYYFTVGLPIGHVFVQTHRYADI